MPISVLTSRTRLRDHLNQFSLLTPIRDHLNQVSCLSVENYEIDNKKGFCIDLCQFLYLQAEHVSAII